MSRERYEPGPVPFDLKQLPEYIQRELRRIGTMLKVELDPAVYVASILEDNSVKVPTGMVSGTNLPFTEVGIDTKNLFDAGTAGVDMSAGAEGFFVMAAYVTWAASAVGDRQVYLTRNGGVLAAVKQRAAASGIASQNIVALENVLDGNTIHVAAFQDSGGTLTVEAAYLMIARIREAVE